jgi:AraC-like DNA-binding protein
MLEARNYSAFRRNPQGGFLAGESWFYFAFDLTLFGYVIWGRPEPEDIRALARLLEVELDRPPHNALVDLGELELVVPEAFEALASYTVKHEKALARTVTHTAIVRPAGVNGAIVAGFFDVSSKPFPVSFWSSLEPALSHLGRIDANDCAASLSAVRAQISGEPALLRRLRAHLSAQLLAPSIEDSARELGLASRTLQRRLSEHRTSFEAEVQRARLRAAERRLDETETPVTTIALDLGFATPQHFSTLFRKHTGQTPTAFRARRRHK